MARTEEILDTIIIEQKREVFVSRKKKKKLTKKEKEDAMMADLKEKCHQLDSDHLLMERIML